MPTKAIILIDIQKEYTTSERPFYLKGIDASLKNCKRLLERARQQHWEIVHIQHLRAAGAARFAADSPYSDFTDGFAPEPNELVITKNLYSCYSSEAFRNWMDQHLGVDIYMIGYNSIMCCLSTAIEGYHRGHRLTLVEDASLAKSTDEFDEVDMHRHSLSIIKTAGYAKLIKTDALMNIK